MATNEIGKGNGIIALVFPQEKILRLLGDGKFPIKHANHLTWAFNVPLEGAEVLVPKVPVAQIVGYSTDESVGVEAIVVSIDGSYQKPYEDGFLHITGSTKEGVPPFRSNKLLEEQGWIPCSGLHLHFEVQFWEWVEGSSPGNPIPPIVWVYNPQTRLFEKPA